MNRRGFLGLLGAVPAALVLPNGRRVETVPVQAPPTYQHAGSMYRFVKVRGAVEMGDAVSWVTVGTEVTKGSWASPTIAGVAMAKCAGGYTFIQTSGPISVKFKA